MNTLRDTIKAEFKAFRMELREVRVNYAINNNLSLYLANRPAEFVPFLVGERPSTLPEIHTREDVDQLTEEEVDAYCVGYRVGGESSIEVKRWRLKDFLKLWQPYTTSTTHGPGPPTSGT